jgi:hypothetical protein
MPTAINEAIKTERRDNMEFSISALDRGSLREPVLLFPSIGLRMPKSDVEGGNGARPPPGFHCRCCAWFLELT